MLPVGAFEGTREKASGGGGGKARDLNHDARELGDVEG